MFFATKEKIVKTNRTNNNNNSIKLATNNSSRIKSNKYFKTVEWKLNNNKIRLMKMKLTMEWKLKTKKM